MIALIIQVSLLTVLAGCCGGLAFALIATGYNMHDPKKDAQK